ncbi:hypothetical protein H696_04194 [Fonticula alba]|uniref:Exportin-T n=1 Tax=Fonticula alba TaxID=691883 RepID=A0A058Z3D2_FONAL|nr:hypothetical protein H696_04194 [Fonticula alba]KCV68775.1 hypothetical protein H696_04194 [Fonticula alba]|eukprot:XP_009496346.1 hypothetical protein H696_04194 [Fonticula alba]
MDYAKFDQAVALCFDSASPADVKAQALEYVEMIRLAPDGWRFCLQLFLERPAGIRGETFYICLQVLQDAVQFRYAAIPTDQRLSLRNSLMQWLSSFATAHANDPVYFKHKFLTVLVHIFMHEYLTSWGSFFQDILSLIHQSPAMVDMYLRILIILDQELISRDIQRFPTEAALATNIKDRMRDTDVPQLVDSWYFILGTYHSSDPGLINLCLSVIGIYVSWIELDLVVTPNFVSAYSSFLKSEQFRDAACECVNGIVLKGMPPLSRLALLDKLHLHNIFEAFIMKSSDISEPVIKLFNDTAVSLISSWNELAGEKAYQAQVYTVIESLLPVLYKLLGESEDTDLGVIFEFSQAFLVLLRQSARSTPLTGEQLAALERLLQILVSKLKFPADFDFSHDDEGRQEVDDFRRTIKIQLDHICSIQQSIFVSFVERNVLAVLSNPSAPYQDAELALFLLYTYSDCIKTSLRFSRTVPPEEQALFSLHAMLHSMITSNIVSYPHSAVQLLFFENAVRYAQFFGVFTEYIEATLVAFLDSRGLRHHDPYVRRRTTYLLARFVRTLLSQLTPHTNALLSGIQELLALPEPTLATSAIFQAVPANAAAWQQLLQDRDSGPAKAGVPAEPGSGAVAAAGQHFSQFDDQLHLFEVVGLLLGNRSFAPAELAGQYTVTVVQPLLTQMSAILQEGRYREAPPGRAATEPRHLALLHMAVTAISHLVKGFPSAQQPAAGAGGGHSAASWEPALRDCLQAALAVLDALDAYQKELAAAGNAPGTAWLVAVEAPMRDAVRQLFQRLVGCATCDLMALVPGALERLLRHASAFALAEFLPVLAQLTFRYREAFLPTLAGLFPAVVAQILPFARQELGLIELAAGSPKPGAGGAGGGPGGAGAAGATTAGAPPGGASQPQQPAAAAAGAHAPGFKGGTAGGTASSSVAAAAAVGATVNTEELQRLNDIRRAYLAFLNAIFQERMEHILVSEVNLPVLPTILASVTLLAARCLEPAIQRAALGVLSRMAVAWLQPGDGQTPLPGGPGAPPPEQALPPPPTEPVNISRLRLPDFLPFALNEVQPLVFSIPLAPTFDVSNASSLAVLNDLTLLQQRLIQTLGVSCTSFLTGQYLPSIGLPADVAADYVNAAMNQDPRQFRQLFRRFITRHRGG